MAINPDRIEFLPLEVAVVPPPGRIFHYANYYWAVDPNRGLLFYRSHPQSLSPQCNIDLNIAHRLDQMYPGTTVQQITSVFVPVTRDGEIRLPNVSEVTPCRS